MPPNNWSPLKPPPNALLDVRMPPIPLPPPMAPPSMLPLSPVEPDGPSLAMLPRLPSMLPLPLVEPDEPTLAMLPILPSTSPLFPNWLKMGMPDLQRNYNIAYRGQLSVRL